MVKTIENNFLLRRIYFNKSEIEQLLMLSALFSVGLTTARIIYTGQWLFAWLSWNLFLAFMPYAITRFGVRNPSWIEKNLKFGALFLCWLLFIPNAFYIITDLFHLEVRAEIPLWFDLALILSFAWTGLLLGILSVRQMEKMVAIKFPQLKEGKFLYPIMLLNAFGIYIGRYLRYNTWDVVTNPFQLTKDIVYMVIRPVHYRFDWSMVFCYAVLMTLMYVAMKKMSKVLW
jgi:uncharacterized membrane protein